MITRIYVVINHADDSRTMVEATSAAQAIRHCVRKVYSARTVSPKELAAHMSGGARVERAEAEPPLQPSEAV